jgi:hypothetical protein
MEITQEILGYTFIGVAMITLLIILVFSRWPNKKDQDD